MVTRRRVNTSQRRRHECCAVHDAAPVQQLATARRRAHASHATGRASCGGRRQRVRSTDEGTRARARTTFAHRSRYTAPPPQGLRRHRTRAAWIGAVTRCETPLRRGGARHATTHTSNVCSGFGARQAAVPFSVRGRKPRGSAHDVVRHHAASGQKDACCVQLCAAAARAPSWALRGAAVRTAARLLRLTAPAACLQRRRTQQLSATARMRAHAGRTRGSLRGRAKAASFCERMRGLRAQRGPYPRRCRSTGAYVLRR
jgi:hypothetical protein